MVGIEPRLAYARHVPYPEENFELRMSTVQLSYSIVLLCDSTEKVMRGNRALSDLE